METIIFVLFVLALMLTFGPPLVIKYYSNVDVIKKFYCKCELTAIILWGIYIVLMIKICPFI